MTASGSTSLVSAVSLCLGHWPDRDQVRRVLDQRDADRCDARRYDTRQGGGLTGWSWLDAPSDVVQPSAVLSIWAHPGDRIDRGSDAASERLLPRGNVTIRHGPERAALIPAPTANAFLLDPVFNSRTGSVALTEAGRVVMLARHATASAS